MSIDRSIGHASSMSSGRGRRYDGRGSDRSLFVVVCLGALVACDRPVPLAHDPASGAGVDAALASDATAKRFENISGTPRDGGHACVGSPLRAYEESPGVLQRVFVELPIDGRSMPFFFDTGSEQTFRRLDPDAGAELVATSTPTTISCMNVGLAFSRASVFGATPDGRRAGGVLGTDLLRVGGVLDLRIRESLFVWSGALPSLPSGTVTLPATFTTSPDPYGRSKLVVDGVALDGKRARLLLDTGSPHVVIVSKVPRANETEKETFDGTGAHVTFYESTIDVAYGGGPSRRVIVDRAASFPTLERVFAAIGGEEIAGVLGIGALGHERIVISKDAVRFVL